MPILGCVDLESDAQVRCYAGQARAGVALWASLDLQGRSRKCAVSNKLSGGPCRIRTCDFDLVTIALYQLS